MNRIPELSALVATSVAALMCAVVHSQDAPSAAQDASKSANAVASSISRFSTLKPGGDLTGWTLQPFRKVKKQTSYDIVNDATINASVIEAKANGAAAALGVRLNRDLKQGRMLRFSWNVGNVIDTSDPRTKEGDDYAARIYVTFAHDPARETFTEKAQNLLFKTIYGEAPPRAALAYVFSHRAKLNEIITSPYAARVKKIVVDADPASVGKWRSFERDLYADYKRVFGEEPTRVSGIAIMVDTDNTGETANARFGDVSLSEN